MRTTDGFQPLLQRRCACGRNKGPAGQCAGCGQQSLAIQTKLTVNRPGDRYEREADQVASMVMADGQFGKSAYEQPGSLLQRQALVDEEEEETLQRQALDDEEEEETLQRQALNKEEEEALQLKEKPNRSPVVPTGTAAQINQMQGGGSPLPETTRTFFESRFGHDFGQVRVHADRQAALAAQDVNARAFTLGQDVFFNAGQYSPSSTAGRQLLAHELTHVIQQNGRTDEHLIQRDLIYGNGYKRPYKSDESEISHAERGDWSPSSVDFKAGVTSSAGGSGAATFKTLLNHIAGKAAGSISELGLVGHANKDNFGLSGTVKGKAVWFTNPGLINTASLKKNKSTIDGKKLHNRFAKDAKIILYGCNAGSGKDLMKAISLAFKVCVHGFKDQIDFCFLWRPPTGKGRRIISRGRVNYAPIDLSDPLAGLESPKSCADFQTNLGNLTPDQKSCAGVPPSAEDLAVESARELASSLSSITSGW